MNTADEWNIRILLAFAFALVVLTHGCRTVERLPKPEPTRYEWRTP